MPCVDIKWVSLSAAVAAALTLGGCATKGGSSQAGSTTPISQGASGAVNTSANKPNASGAAAPTTTGKLGAPSTPRTWEDARLQAARRIVAANPEQTYTGKPPDMLLAIPVLSIELNADGSIRNIDVMRKPSQALDTIDLAKQAIRRAAPFGDVSRLPKPWKFNETFLFNDQRKFKPMTLDQR